jgi:hypothetical protein
MFWIEIHKKLVEVQRRGSFRSETTTSMKSMIARAQTKIHHLYARGVTTVTHKEPLLVYTSKDKSSDYVVQSYDYSLVIYVLIAWRRLLYTQLSESYLFSYHTLSRLYYFLNYTSN